MTAAAAHAPSDARLLTFELGGSVYALPIACVVEVCEAGPAACIPTLPLEMAGVINHHGDALPVLSRHALFDGVEHGDATHILVISHRPDGGARLGVPADRIVGLVDSGPGRVTGAGPIVERRPIDGRVVFVLDPRRLVARAKDAIERSLEPSG